MAATLQEIKGWFDRGKARGHSHMIVWCDTYDHDDYPCYYNTREQAQEALKSPHNMQRPMEVYNLSKDRDDQLGHFRSWDLS